MARTKSVVTKTPRYHVAIIEEGSGWFQTKDDGETPLEFDSEEAALEAAREYGEPAVVLRAVAKVTETHKTHVVRLD